MEEHTVRPGLSSAWLKYLACISMLIDHLAHVWDPVYALASSVTPPPLWGDLFYYLGRPAFPIFVFFVAEGCRRTQDRKRYLLRLGLFALLSQLPFALLFQQWGGNVLLTLFLGALGVFCYDTLRPRVPALAAGLPILVFAFLAVVLNSDYGWVGVLLVPAVYLCGAHRRRALACLGVGLVVLYLFVTPTQYLLLYWVPPGGPFFSTLPEVLPAYLSMHLPRHLAVTASALLALIPLAFYDGTRGRGSKWFFYLFYPVHLLVLWGLKCLIT